MNPYESPLESDMRQSRAPRSRYQKAIKACIAMLFLLALAISVMLVLMGYTYMSPLAPLFREN